MPRARNDYLVRAHEEQVKNNAELDAQLQVAAGKEDQYPAHRGHLNILNDAAHRRIERGARQLVLFPRRSATCAAKLTRRAMTIWCAPTKSR
jgi:hypothetical protein